MFVRSARRGSDSSPVQGCRQAEVEQGVRAKAAAREPLTQRQLDLIGLGCVLLGIYLVFVLYFGWNGGRLGEALSDGLKYVFGLGAFLAPPVAVRRGCDRDLPAVAAFDPAAADRCRGAAGRAAARPRGWHRRSRRRRGRTGSPGSIPGWFPDHGGVIGESLLLADRHAASALRRPSGRRLRDHRRGSAADRNHRRRRSRPQRQRHQEGRRDLGRGDPVLARDGILPGRGGRNRLRR